MHTTTVTTLFSVFLSSLFVIFENSREMSVIFFPFGLFPQLQHWPVGPGPVRPAGAP